MKNPNRYVWFGLPLWLIAFISSWVRYGAYPGTSKFADEIQLIKVFITFVLAGMILLSVFIYKNRETNIGVSILNTAMLASVISIWSILLFPRSDYMFFVFPLILGVASLLPKYLQNRVNAKRILKDLPLLIGVMILVYVVETLTLYAAVMPFYTG